MLDYKEKCSGIVGLQTNKARFDKNKKLIKLAMLVFKDYILGS